MNNTEENCRIVAEGLEHRRELRMEAQREEAQEAYEQDMILACNLHCADAKKDREDRERILKNREKIKMRRAQMAKAKADRVRLECAANNAVRVYGVLALVTMLVCATTPMPFYGAAAFLMGDAAIMAAYIFRLFYPIER